MATPMNLWGQKYLSSFTLKYNDYSHVATLQAIFRI